MREGQENYYKTKIILTEMAWPKDILRFQEMSTAANVNVGDKMSARC